MSEGKQDAREKWTCRFCGSDYPVSEACAMTRDRQANQPQLTPDEFIDNWIGWIPVKDRSEFALQVRRLASLASVEPPQEKDLCERCKTSASAIDIHGLCQRCQREIDA